MASVAIVPCYEWSMSWRDTARTQLTDLGVVDHVRTGRHFVHSRGGRRDHALVERYLDSHDAPRLQLGCGTRLLDGWLNSDFSPRTSESIRIDATKRLPFDDATFVHVYSEHMIEHLDYVAGQHLLGEIRRVLRPGGRLRISTPDLARLLALFGRADGYTDDERAYVELIIEQYVPGVDPSEANPVFVLNNNVRQWGHQFLYDRPTFRSALEQAGFDQIDEFELQASDDPVLQGLANETRLPPGLVAFETMTFEAVSP